ncbi:MAG: pentapeptide repeat-containing protein, partial [Myxococcales bacterium]|nr:pentapeptide repeat-containing protein [Myxococcales bacterium]
CERVQFGNSDLTEVNLSGVEFREGISFYGAALDGANLEGSRGDVMNFVQASLVGANLKRLGAREGVFVEADLSSADLSEADLERAVLQDAICVGTRFRGAKLTYADFSRSDLCQADLSDALMFRTRFHDIKEQDTVWGNRSIALGDDPALRRAENWKPTY